MVTRAVSGPHIQFKQYTKNINHKQKHKQSKNDQKFHYSKIITIHMVGNILSDISLDTYISTHTYIFLHKCNQNHTCYFVTYLFHSAVCWVYLFMTTNTLQWFSTVTDAETQIFWVLSSYLHRINSYKWNC